MTISRRNFLPAGIAFASLFAINGVGAQEIEVFSNATHLQVSVFYKARRGQRALPRDGFWCRVVDLNGYCPYALKTNRYGRAYFVRSLIRGIDRPCLVVADQRRNLFPAMPPFGVYFTV